MKKKTLIIGAIAATTMLAGGWALAQSTGRGAIGLAPPFMRGQGHEEIGPGMMKGMGHRMKGMDHSMGPGMMKGMGPKMMHGQTGQGLGDRAQIETLKNELGITPAQEAAWAKYVRVVQDAAATMKTTRQGVDPDVVSKMTPADRFAFVSKMREQGQKEFGAVREAAEELLVVLNESQKATAEDTLPGLALGPGAMRGSFTCDQEQKH